MTANDAKHARILLVDDDRQLGAMVSELLETDGLACSVVHDGDSALRAIRHQPPDLVVLDVMMPGLDGIETLEALRQFSDVPVIMLTALGEDEDRVLGLQTGADDYLAKPFVARELLLRIRAILKRTAPGVSDRHADGDLVLGPLRLEPARHRASIDERPLSLTGAELKILQALAAQAGSVVSREYLNQFALGRPLTPYDRALDTHMSHLRRKLAGADSAGRFTIRSVRGSGYKLVVD